MKCRILQVVIVQRDKHRQPDQGQGEIDAEGARLGVGEGGVAHEAGGIDHAELVDELHRVFERGVEEEGASADEEVADEGDQEDGVVRVAPAGADAKVGQIDKEEVR